MSDVPTPPEPPYAPQPPEPQPGPGYYPVATPSASLPTHEHASLSLGLGVVGLLGSVFCLGLLAAPFAIGFGVSARRAIRREPERWKGDGMALTGIILGVIGVVILALVIVGVFVVAIMVMNGSFDTTTTSSGFVST